MHKSRTTEGRRCNVNTLNNEEKQIVESLKQMPKMKDNMDKNVLYQRISSELNETTRRPKKNNKLVLIPIISTFMVLLLLVVMVPSLMNNSMFQSNNESSKLMQDTASDETQDSGQESSGEFSEAREGSDASEESLPHVSMMDKAVSSHVIYSTDDNTKIIHAALAESKGQYVIPLSISIPKTDNAEGYYNQLENYLDEESWGLSEYIFTETSFQLDQINGQVYVTLPKDFSVGEGSTGPNLFEDILTAMFHPYQINKVVFSQQVNLGQIGNVKELPLITTRAIYKRYQMSVKKREFLVKIPVDKQTNIEEALIEMQKDEKKFNVYQSIPNNIEFSIDPEGKLLHLSFVDKDAVSNNRSSIMMIESILMTAKSFGYQEVSFENAPYEAIGPYNLTEPIKVPQGVNPIPVKND